MSEDWKRFNDQFRETEYERNSRLRAARLKRTRPVEWTATQHAIADMFDAGMTHEQIKVELSNAAKIAAKQIMADLDKDRP